ncbi:NB-ARC domains-containing protein [Tanacetum coccineum]
MATTSVPHRWKYDVFVSFRGEDIRKNFMDHLFNDFNQKGIFAFRDDNELPKGEEISPHLYKAIEESRFLIVIFSKDYASSSWKQTGSYAEAFAKHQVSHRPEVDNSKEALSMAANLSGWDLQDMTNGYEYKFINCISKGILKILCDGPLHVGENLVGVDFHFDKLNLSRFIGSDKVNMIGICGVSKQQGATQVQMQMIGKIMKTENLTISSVADGAMVIKQRMSCQRVLLVFDDVDDHDQLEAIAGSHTWFCPGSLIIFTAKDKQLLRSHRVDEIHDMDFLDEDRSLELFRSYAFKEKDSSTDFKEVSQKVVKDFVATVLDGCNLFAVTNMQVLVDKSLIAISSKMSLQMHDLIQAMAREFVREESIMTGKQRRLWNSSEVYHVLSEKKVSMTEAIEVVVLLLRKSSQKVHINANSFALMKNLRILKIYVEEEFPPKLELKGYDLNLEGCVNLVSVHPSIGMLKRLVVLNLTGCLKVDQLPEALGRIKSLMELHVDKTAVTELPSFVSSLINLESLSFGGQGKIQPRLWTSITAPSGLHMLKSLKLSYCNLEQVPESIGGLSCLKRLNLEGNNLLEVLESIGGLSCLMELNLQGNNFSSLPGSLSQLSHLQYVFVGGCKNLEVLPELPPSIEMMGASDYTSLREVSGSIKDPFKRGYNYFRNCPKLFKNVSIDSKGCISKTQSFDSSITSQGFIHRLSAFLGYLGIASRNCPKLFKNVSIDSEGLTDVNSSCKTMAILGFGTCLVFKCKKPFNKFKVIFVKSFDDALIIDYIFPDLEEFGKDEDYIWLHYTRYIEGWEEAKNFVTFSFEVNNEDVEVKEFGVRLICDEDIEQEAHLSMLQGLPTPTQHGGKLGLRGRINRISWSW